LFSQRFSENAQAASANGGVPRAFAPSRIASRTGRTESFGDICSGTELFSIAQFGSPVWLGGGDVIVYDNNWLGPTLIR